MTPQYATAPTCTRCRGRSYERGESCPRCGDSGEEPIEHEEAHPAPLPYDRAECVGRWLTYYAERAIRAARPIASDDTLRRLVPIMARDLARTERVDRVVAFLAGWHVTESDAHAIVRSYVDAASEQARAFRRSRRGERRELGEMQARRCEEHAARINEQLPLHARAVA